MASRFEIPSPFGVAFLEVTEDAARPSSQNVRQVDVTLPVGQRVDGCLVGEIRLQTEGLARLELLLGCDAAPGIEIGGSGGESLHAIEAEGRGLNGAIAIRDDEWFAARFGCKAHWVSDSRGSVLTLEEFQKVPLSIEFAVAWVEAAVIDAEKVAPWFAVDLALRS